MGELISALDALALDMRQRGYQVHMATVLSNLRLSDPITAFLYRAVRSFLQQVMSGDVSSLITVSAEGEQASTLRVRAAISGRTRSSGADAFTPGPAVEKSFLGIQARGTLLGIAVSVETTLGMTIALVLDVPLPVCSDHH